MDEDGGNDHDAVIEFATYEDFLDSQISTLDLYYLEVYIFKLKNSMALYCFLERWKYNISISEKKMI